MSFIGVLIGGLIILAVPIVVIYLIVRALGGGHKPLTLNQLKRGALATAIGILLPTFIALSVKSVFPDTNDPGGFAIGALLSLGAIAAGIAARRNNLVGSSLSIGGLIALFYTISIRFPNFSPPLKASIVAIGLLAATAATYWLGAKKQDNQQPLHGVKSIVAGIVIYTFAMLLVININGALNPEPKYPEYPIDPIRPLMSEPFDGQKTLIAPVPESDPIYQEKQRTYERELSQYNEQRKVHQRNTFIIVMTISFFYLLAGLFIRAVSAVSLAYIAAGLTSIFYTLVVSFDELGRAAMAVITGLGLIVLITLAYWKFGQEE